MRIETKRRETLCVLAGLMLLVGCSKSDDEQVRQVVPENAVCERDEQSEEASAVALDASTEVKGFVCPEQDVDWWSYSMPASDKILEVKLKLDSKISPIQPTYKVFTADGQTGLASPNFNDIGQALSDSHCIEPGPLLVQVSDSGDDAQDIRHQYALEISSKPDPDTNEPNQSKDAAKQLMSGVQVQGFIACQGDQDFYTFTVPQGSLVQFKFNSDVTSYQPAIEIRNGAGDLLVEDGNKGASVRATEIDRYEVLEGGGTYTLLVKDDDDNEADTNVPYTLSVDFIQDNDPNEPNNKPAEATKVSTTPISCASTSQEFTFTGTIGSASDSDWFEIPLQGCDRAILDAEVALNLGGLSPADAWELNRELQATLTMVRGHKESPCNDDRSCDALQISCDNDIDCAGFSGVCLPQKLCAGASVCLPNSQCGAEQVQRRYECNPAVAECKPSAMAPPANQARMSAPIFGGEVIYLRVGDFRADRGAPDLTYNLKVRLRPITDGNEPDNVYLATIDDSDSVNVGPNKTFAKEITVHDCTAGDCCDGSKWETGKVEYDGDLDWLKYQHPCPGEDCTLRMHYEVDAGPVDTVINLYRDSRLWFTAFETEELASQGGISGTMGGTTMQDRCFYAYQGHKERGDATYYYYVVVRDLLESYKSLNIPKPDSRDWSATQGWKVCVEKLTNDCSQGPCKLYDDGCGQPERMR